MYKTFRLMPAADLCRAAIDHVINHRIQIKLLAIQLVGDPRQIFRLHQLKLVADGRNHAFVALASFLDKSPIAMLHALFNHPAPAQTVIGQLPVPLVIVVSHLAFFNRLLRQIGFGPGLRARQFIRLAFLFGIVPGS